MEKLCLMALKMKVGLPLEIVYAIMVFVVLLSLDDSYRQFLCRILNKLLVFNTKDHWLYLKSM